MEAVTEAEFDQVKAWLASQPVGLPEPLRLVIERLLLQYLWLLKSAARAKETLRTLRVAMGFIPKSERGAQLIAAATKVTPASGAASNDDDPVAADLRRKRDRAIHQKAYYEGKLRRHAATRKHQASATAVDMIKAATSIELSQPVEKMFTGPLSETSIEPRNERMNRERDFIVKKGLHSTYDHVTRVDLEVKITKIDLRVESVTDPTTGQHGRANIDHIGPAGFQLTWKAMSNLLKMVVGFAIPINRVALMLGSPHFTPAKIYRVLEFAARLALPIYLHLAEALGEADVLSGDDSPTRVLITGDPPETVGTNLGSGKAKPPSIHSVIDAALGWQQPLASGKGDKTRLNVSLIMGKMVAADPRSSIAFFRTHLGDVGNVLTKMLENRRPSTGPVVIQGDLSTANLPSPEIRKKISVTLAGCAAHARRPYWRWREDDQELCYYMLRCFLTLSEVERMIDLRGRTQELTLRLRRKYSRWLWDAIRNRAIAAMTGIPPTPGCMPRIHGAAPFHWPPDSKLYKACAYIVKNFATLTAYLDDARLDATNNQRERGLRAEQAMLVSSKFRRTRNGRAVLDVLRTMNATCTMAGIDIGEYLRRLYAARADLEARPHLYTPYALATKAKTHADAQASAVH
jgi:hypothetical protein